MNSSPPHRPQPFLSLRGAAFRLGDHLLFEQTSWVFHRHEHWAIIGANGSGKSLLADALRGRLPLAQGELRYHFRPPRGLTHEEAISHVSFEDRKADVHETVVQSRWNSLEEESAALVRDFLSYERVMEINPFEVTSRHDQERPRFERRMRRAVILLQVSALLNRSLISLSSGERQRVQLARAFSHPMRLLILDEPFVGLDTAARGHFHALLERLMDTPLRVLLITTRLDDLPRHITHLLCVAQSRVLAAGPRAAILTHPKVQRLFAGSKPETRRPKTLKSEARRPKAERRPRAEIRRPKPEAERGSVFGLQPSGFGLLSAFDLRPSDLTRLRSSDFRAAEPDLPSTGRTLEQPWLRPVAPELVRLRHVTVRYGNTVILSDINWTIHAGESWALLGSNGSGKTTLLSLILGDNPQAYTNDIVVFGQQRGSGESVWDIKKHIGWVSPELHLHFNDSVTCFEVVASAFHDTVGLFEPPSARQKLAARPSQALHSRGGCAHPCGSRDHHLRDAPARRNPPVHQACLAVGQLSRQRPDSKNQGPGLPAGVTGRGAGIAI
ncbi:MAG: ATP-binding cassette domain-containing protein [Verrucomicrobia bacterium]|nr:ATP-binding cassette domain-containing protein [Verrucomicrobiota bacterium]